MSSSSSGSSSGSSSESDDDSEDERARKLLLLQEQVYLFFRLTQLITFILQINVWQFRVTPTIAELTDWFKAWLEKGLHTKYEGVCLPEILTRLHNKRLTNFLRNLLDEGCCLSSFLYFKFCS